MFASTSEVCSAALLLYDRSSSKTSANALHKHLFTKKGRSMDSLPPTEAALLQHVRRAALQSGYN